MSREPDITGQKPAEGGTGWSGSHGIILSRLQDLVAWGRKNSLWPLNFGTSCCYIEMAAAVTPKYDMARFGAEVLRGSPREADLLIVAGTVFVKVAPILKQLYDQMMEPRWVISMGSCANSGGMYDIYSVVQGVDSFLPVDVYVPGCPPRPEALLEGLMLLQRVVAAENRPLSWVLGPKGFEKPEMSPMRDTKRASRRAESLLKPPDEVEKTPGVEVHVSHDEGRRVGQTTDGVDGSSSVIDELRARFGTEDVRTQSTADGTPTVWVRPERLREVLGYLKNEATEPFRTLLDLTAIDERVRLHRSDQPESDFTVVYQLLSYGRNEDVRVKAALNGDHASAPSVIGLWPSANWYEREVWDMFGVAFDGHPDLRRILLPPTWKGHPLRKDHPARATEMGAFQLPESREEVEQAALALRPEEFAGGGRGADRDLMYLNLGPHHPAAHGVFRVGLEMDGEEIVDALPDIGYHHRGAEKMGERQSWHTFIPYTDRIDYLAGVVNELPYVLAVEKLAGIDVPARAQVIRVMMTELFRVASHLVWFGTFAQDLGALSPVFYAFSDREVIFDIIEAISGFRMHPIWFRLGGVAADLPKGWDGLVRSFLDYMPRRLKEYETIVMGSRIVKLRTKGVGALTLEEAIDWGVTGPNLRACGFEWDFRKKRPYSGYEQFDFDIPVGDSGDSYDRAAVRMEEMRQSLRIIEQCLLNMPGGPYKSEHVLTTPPLKERTMSDIETLIPHFLGVSWGPVVPAGEAAVGVEAAKGNNTYYLISDGNTGSYRTRIRTPSFAHLQTVPMLCRGRMVSDLIAILGSLDYVMGDCDR